MKRNVLAPAKYTSEKNQEVYKIIENFFCEGLSKFHKFILGSLTLQQLVYETKVNITLWYRKILMISVTNPFNPK